MPEAPLGYAPSKRRVKSAKTGMDIAPFRCLFPNQYMFLLWNQLFKNVCKNCVSVLHKMLLELSAFAKIKPHTGMHSFKQKALGRYRTLQTTFGQIWSPWLQYIMWGFFLQKGTPVPGLTGFW